MNLRTIAISSAFAFCTIAPSIALAQEAPPQAPPQAPADAAEVPDGVRFRGAVSGEGGALIVPDVVNLGLAGVQAQLGVQINHLIGIYAVPQIDVVFGEVGGVHLAAALLVDFTPIDEISVGIGPEVGVFGAIGAGDGSIAGAGGELYGGRLHLGFQPAWGRGEDGIRRKAFNIGLDVRFLGGVAGMAKAGATTSADASQFVLSPMLSIGYQAF